MFRKLVSSLPLSPVVAGRLASYLRSVKRQESICRFGLLFAVLVGAVQIYIILNPSEEIQASPVSPAGQYYQSEPGIIRSRTIINLSQNIDATKVTAHPGDSIEYLLQTTNTTNRTLTTDIVENLTDVLDYSFLNETGGGNFDPSTQTLSWSNIVLAPHSTDKRQIVVQLLDSIPSTPVAANNPLMYDCKMTDAYGNMMSISVACPTTKLIENVVRALPPSNSLQSLTFAAILILVSAYFFIRSKQLHKELDILRKEFDNGTI